MAMRIFVLGDETPDLSSLERALRMGEVEIVAPNENPVPVDDGQYAFGGWRLDSATRELVGAAGQRPMLTSLEFDLLFAFVRSPGRALSRAELVGALRGRRWSYFDRSIDTLVARLRKKVLAPGRTPLIRSVRGVGYVFCARVSQAGEALTAQV
jgi:DNA-binding response OmpR family regulator